MIRNNTEMKTANSYLKVQQYFNIHTSGNNTKVMTGEVKTCGDTERPKHITLNWATSYWNLVDGDSNAHFSGIIFILRCNVKALESNLYKGHFIRV